MRILTESRGDKQVVPPTLSASLEVAPKRRSAWRVVIQQGARYVLLIGKPRLCFSQIEIELAALLTALNWLRHVKPRVRCQVRVSLRCYRLLFGQKASPKLNNVMREIRQAHISLRCHTIILPHLASLKRSDSAPVLALVPPQKPTPTSGLRRAA